MSLEKGICSCAELQDFSCYRGWKEACQATRAISTTWRRGLSSSFFFLSFAPARQGAEGNSSHSDRNIRGTCTIVCHRQKLGGPVWTWWFFHLWCASSWTTQNWPSRRLLIKYTRLVAVACFLPGRAKDLSASPRIIILINIHVLKNYLG